MSITVSPFSAGLGAGPIGALTIAALLALGIDDVKVSEPAPLRQDLAQRLGAKVVISPAELEDPGLFDPGKIVDFVGIERDEGDELIAELTRAMIQPEAEYHHKWQKGDIVIWDNRCSYHRAAGDYPPEEDRIHWRVSINDFGVEARATAE